MQLTLLIDLAIAVGLGLLVGAERERALNPIAGVRTFTFITMLGVMAGAASTSYGGWIAAAALLGVGALLVTGNLILLRTEERDPGMTTEVAALLMFTVGVAVASGYRLAGAVAAGATALLLHWKRPLNSLINRFGEAEYRAIMRMVLIGLVILPALPNRNYGPYGVINPFQIWLMVVLIVGISLAGYIAWRLFGATMGVLLGGIIGGLISSTAATVGYARRARRSPEDTDAAAVMILIASTVVFGRVLFEVAVVAPSTITTIGPPLAAMLILMVGICAFAWRRSTTRPEAPQEPSPPSDLRAAIAFGLLYAAVLFGVALAREHFGTGALYGVAALSGLTDVDAITLSTAQLVRADRLDTDTAWRVILVGAMANLVFKAGAVAALGNRRLFGRIASAFGVAIAGGLIVMGVWGQG